MLKNTKINLFLCNKLSYFTTNLKLKKMKPIIDYHTKLPANNKIENLCWVDHSKVKTKNKKK